MLDLTLHNREVDKFHIRSLQKSGLVLDTASFLDRSLEETKAELYLQALSKGHSISFIAHGTSMLPSIIPGSRLTVSPCKVDHLKKGDILLTVQPMQSNSKTQGSIWVVHRLIKHCHLSKVLFTRGDRLPIFDTPQCYETVKGVITAIEFPQQGRLSLKHYFFQMLIRKPRQFHSRYAGVLISNLYQIYFRLKKVFGQ